MTRFPAVEAAVSVLAHVPELCRYGSKPARQIAADGRFGARLQDALRSVDAARAYLPNQVFLGALDPEVLWEQPRPWWNVPPRAQERAPFGPMVSQQGFYGLLKRADAAGLITLDPAVAAAAGEELAALGMIGDTQARESDRAENLTAPPDGALPLYIDGRIVGWVAKGHDDDAALAADVLLENLAAKASAALAVDALLAAHPEIDRSTIQYVINSGEEAVGDRYQRGGGNLAKAVAEVSGLANSTGADVKAFCCAPVHALVIAGALVQSGVYRRVLVIGGGSVAKLGMKSTRHLDAGMPVLEDVLGAFAILVGPGDGRSPHMRLDAVGRQDVRCGSAPLRIVESLVSDPLARLGRTMLDVDRYAVELHNPDITEPAGSGDVPRTNYRTIGSLAARHKLILPSEIGDFERHRGLPGFSPTQGHVASAVPFVPHAVRLMREGRLRSAMFIAKGSLFLGKMTNMADGISVLLEQPE
jgi:glycine/sarcosine/betaine reductase complex component C subunit beta